MTSHRKRKKLAQRQARTAAEQDLCALLREVLDLLRWTQVLGYGNQYLLQQRLQLGHAEQQRVLEAAARAVEQDGRLAEFQRRLGAVEAALRRSDGAATDGAEAAGG